MSLWIMPQDNTTRTLVFPPKNKEEDRKSIKKVVIIGSVIAGILTGGWYTLKLSQNTKKWSQELDKVIEDIGNIPGIEYIHLSK